MDDQKSVGKSFPKVDSFAKATGQTKFISDLHRPGMLFAKLLLSDRPHAKILSIDFSEAEKMPGVEKIITGNDNPGRFFGLYIQDRQIFAEDRVRFVGEPVAALAAQTEKQAVAAIKKIKVEYEDLPAIFDVESALKEDAPIIHPDVKEYSRIHDYISYDNVCMDAKLRIGDIEKGFKVADQIFEDTYQTHAAHHVALEPHSCLAEIDIDGRLLIWTGTQQLSICHVQVATALDMPMNKIRVIPAWIGGGFGGKVKAQFEPIVGLLAKFTNKPVKLKLNREEEFFIERGRPPFKIIIKTGVMNDGTIVARDFEVIADAGGFSDHVVGVVTHSILISQGPYNIPNCKAWARAVYTNNRDWGCMRGYGAVQTVFAVESHMDSIAEGLTMDPAEFRLINLVKDGDIMVSTQEYTAVRIQQTMDKALAASNYFEKKGNLKPNRGIGIANSVVLTGLLSSSAIVRINEDETVSILTAVTDIGTGSHTVLGQIAAEALGVPFSTVSIASLDSDSSPYDNGSIASRTTYDSGNAVRLAAEDTRKKIIKVAAFALECEEENVEWVDGKAFHADFPEKTLTLKELIGISLYAHQGPLIGQGTWLAAAPWKEKVGEGYGENPYGTFMFGTHVAEVEVDPITGKTTIINYTACHDVGKAINPIGVQGQIEGGVAQGIGFGLFEDSISENGKMINPNLTDYRVPTILDLPTVNVIIDENPDPTGPFGAKGIGEPPIIPPAAAIANAIFDAVGVRVKTTPISMEKLYFAIRKRGKAAN